MRAGSASLDGTGNALFNNGPLIDPVCFFDKFMVVASPNSLDAFSFLLPVLF